MLPIRALFSQVARSLRVFRRDERGVTALEFGLLAFPFFGILAGIMQTALVFLAGNVLESAVNDASREIRTGQVQQRGMTLEQFRADVCNRTSGLIADCNGLYIRVDTVTDFQSSTVTTPPVKDCQTGCQWADTPPQTFTPGQGRSIVVARVFYRYPIIIPMVGMDTLPDGSRLLGAVAVFQNEPFTW